MSDADGRFAFRGLDPDPTYVLCAFAPARASVWRQARTGEDVRLVLDARSSVEGTVVEAETGAPVAGAVVRSDGGDAPRESRLNAWLRARLPEPVQTTGADGAFGFSGLRGRVTIAVQSAQHRLVHRIVHVANTTEPLRIELHRGRDLVFEIVDGETGAPLSDATIAFPALGDGAEPILRADAAGRVVWVARTADAESKNAQYQWLRAQAPGYADLSVSLDWAADANETARIEMLRGATLSGTILAPDGAPRANAVVDLRPVFAPTIDSDVPQWQKVDSVAQWRSMRSGAQGEYRFDELPVGDWTLAATHGHERVPAPVALRTSEPGESVRYNVQLVDGAAIEGRVTRDGKPVAADLVALGPGNDRRNGRADAGGAFRLEGLAPGDWRVAFAHGGSIDVKALERTDPRTLAAGETIEWDCELAPSGMAAIAGFATFSNGEPVRGVGVSATGPAGVVRLRASTMTGDDGGFRFEVPNDAEALWTVHCSVRVASASAHDVRPSDEGVLLTLPTLQRIGVRVVEGDGGAELELEQLEWRRVGETDWKRVATVLDEDGGRRAELPIGHLDLRASVAGREFFPGELAVDVLEGADQVLTFALERGIVLTLHAASSEGVPGVPFDWLPYLRVADVESMYWRGNPALEYGPLRPGEYELVGSHAAYTFEPSRLELSSALRQRIDVTWHIVDPVAFQALADKQEKMRERVRAGQISAYY